MFVTVIHPQIESKLRRQKMLPSKFRSKTRFANGAMSAPRRGFVERRLRLYSRSLKIFGGAGEKSFIPKFDEIKEQSKLAGALGGGISGSGPSIFMLSENRSGGAKSENAMKEIYGQTQIDLIVTYRNKCGRRKFID